MSDPSENQSELRSALCNSQRLDIVGETTGGMIHELNNSLSVVHGLVELLLETAEHGFRGVRRVSGSSCHEPS